MKGLHFLIKSLTKGEKEKAKKRVACFSDNKREDKKSLRLFKQLDKHETYAPPSALALKIYKEENADALEKLAQRLQTKIFESVILCIEPGGSGSPDERILMLMKARQMLSSFNYLYETKGALGVLPGLLEKIISLCKKYELYSTLVEALGWKKRCYAASEGENKWKEVQKEIIFYKQARDAVETAHDYLDMLQFREEFKGRKNENEILELLENAIADLKMKYVQTNSALVNYFLYYMEYEREILLKNYLAARSIILELLSYIKKHKCLNSAQRAGIAFNHLEICEMSMGRFDQALDHAHNAFNYIPKNSFNYLISKEWEFYALFFNKQFAEAIACAQTITSPSARKETGEFRFEKFNCLLAFAVFKSANHQWAEEILSQKFELKNDKEGWEFNWRVLAIMNDIELGKEDAASRKTACLHSFMHSAENKNNISFTPRQRMIEKLLTHLAYKSFDFNTLNGKAHDYMLRLSSSETGLGWQILSSELIPFHGWANAKMKKGVKVLVR